jgi:hypothetical protein
MTATDPEDLQAAGKPEQEVTGHYLGLDLGQAADYSAIALVRRVEAYVPVQIFREWGYENARTVIDHFYELCHLSRARGLPYPRVAEQVRSMVLEVGVHADEPPVLAVDATGVGKPVVDLLRERGLAPMAITITGGSTVTEGDDKTKRVPKIDLVGAAVVALQTKRLRVAADLLLAQTLVDELLHYRVTVSAATAHESFDARSGAHDDLVLAVALALWAAENVRSVRLW